VNEIETLRNIYNEIFLKEADSTVNIFLCGLSSDDISSLRNRINDSLRDNSRVNIVFPEWLFSDLLDHRDYDLLNLEKELAKSVDLIILPIEGTGAVAELGVFATLKRIRGKVIVFNSSRYKWKKSFINLGPIKLIRRNYPNNIIYYDENNIDNFINKLAKRVNYTRNREPKNDVMNLFNLSRFMLFVIGIFQPIEKDHLIKILLSWNNRIRTHHFEPCLNILIKKEAISSKIDGYMNYFSLTEKGHDYVFENLLPNLGKSKYFSDIRTEVINSKYRRKRGIDFVKEGERLLALTS
jgi:hypothetical protein